ncbi:MAG TPA: aldo/keto reductase [Acidimicrobiales bacterium]|nr:aldo/keto reductase [Acidimicrobiales bacterium]
MEVGLGLAALGRPAYINLGRDRALPVDRTVEALREASWQVLDAAYAAGVRWVDVARSYGRAEEFLAGWLADRGVSDLTVSSKWGYAYVGGWRTDAEVHETKEHSLARFSQQWAESQALLGGQIAHYQVHSLTPDSPVFADRPLLEALAGLAAQGVRVGFSTSGPAQAEVVERALTLQVAGQPVFTAVQSTWNVSEPSVGPTLDQAHRHGVLVLVKETLANGRLAERPPAGLVELAERHGVTPDAVAVGAVLSQPWADTVLVGPVSPGQLASNLHASALRLTDHDMEQLAMLAEPSEDYWSQRSALRWH